MSAPPIAAMKTARKRRNPRGALLAVAALFVFSGLIRLGDGLSKAIAAETEATIDTTVPGTTDAPGAAELLHALQEREAKLAEREKMIADRTQALSLSEKAIDERLVALEKAEVELSATLALADKAAEEDLARLTAVYEAMKPKDAALIFEAMEPEFSAGFLTRMRPETAGAVMAGLSAEKAYAISVVVAGRNSEVPTE